MLGRAGFVVALLVEIVGAALVLLVATRDWQTITTVRARPFSADVLGVSGRTLDGAPTALALVALAGVVAVLATKGLVRRVIGALVALAGVGIMWRSIAAAPPVGTARAAGLVRAKHETVGASAVVTQHVASHPGWAVLSAVGGLLVLVAGVLVAWHGGRWGAMSARYERPAGSGVEARPEHGPEDIERNRARADAALWTALERGDDPTADESSEPSNATEPTEPTDPGAGH
jgi:uncharacterized membrane protein (TIGR02234 family)